MRPITCQGPVTPGDEIDARAMAADHVLGFVRNQRPGPDEAHLAPQHVPELRQLVERVAAQQAADAA